MGFSREAARILIARNAIACELALKPKCTCACGGTLHGIKHSGEWQQKVLDEQAWAASGYQLCFELDQGKEFYGLKAN